MADSLSEAFIEAANSNETDVISWIKREMELMLEEEEKYSKDESQGLHGL